MEFIQRIFLYLACASLLFLIVGLFKPWVMLWWEHTQNRKKIIKIYGSATVVTFVIYYILLSI
jgi:hypothetical protein